MVLMQLPLLAKNRYKFNDAGIIILCSCVGVAYLQTQPVAAFSPGANVALAGAQTLFRAPGVPQVIDGDKAVRGIARAH